MPTEDLNIAGHGDITSQWLSANAICVATSTWHSLWRLRASGFRVYRASVTNARSGTKCGTTLTLPLSTFHFIGFLSLFICNPLAKHLKLQASASTTFPSLDFLQYGILNQRRLPGTPGRHTTCFPTLCCLNMGKDVLLVVRLSASPHTHRIKLRPNTSFGTTSLLGFQGLGFDWGFRCLGFNLIIPRVLGRGLVLKVLLMVVGC